MAEKLNRGVESEKSYKSPENSTGHAQSHEREITRNEQEHGQENQIKQLKSEALEKAVGNEELKLQSEAETTTEKKHPVLVNKQLKEMAYTRALTRARKQLSAPSRLFSKTIHSSLFDKPSEALGKTVARPSAMLGGAFFALLGTSLLLWVTKRYGYEYNYLAVVVLFGGGMIVGLSIEGLLRLIRRRR